MVMKFTPKVEEDIVAKWREADVRLPKEINERLALDSAFSGYKPLFKYLQAHGQEGGLRATFADCDYINVILNGCTILCMNIMPFPSCCGMALASNLTMYDSRNSHLLGIDRDTVIKLFTHAIKFFYRTKRVTKLIFTVSAQEYAHQEAILRDMGFYDYSEPFISCRTNHKLQTLVLDCYSEEEMKLAVTRYKETYVTKRLYDAG